MKRPRSRIKRVDGAIPLLGGGAKRPHAVRPYGTVGLETRTAEDEWRAWKRDVRVGKLLHQLARTLDLTPEDIPALVPILVGAAKFIRSKRLSGAKVDGSG